jgi:hypothetical protein
MNLPKCSPEADGGGGGCIDVDGGDGGKFDIFSENFCDGGGGGLSYSGFMISSPPVLILVSSVS